MEKFIRVDDLRDETVKLTKNVVTTVNICVIGVILFYVLFLLTVEDSGTGVQPSSKDYEVFAFDDYTAVYVDKRTMMLIEKNGSHGSFRFSEEALMNLSNFTNCCINCQAGTKCLYEDGKVQVRLTDVYGMVMNIYDFHKCKLPSRCYFQSRSFKCSFLVALTSIITG